MNIFEDKIVAKSYDDFYNTELGKRIDVIEKSMISELIKNIPKGEMLELGCGTGHWTEYFLQQNYEILAIDTSEPMLEIAIKKNLKAKFINKNSENLPFADNSYSVISSITMIEFVENKDKVFSEIYRILKPNGWFILGSLNANSILAKNKNNDKTFKNAIFLTPKELEQKLDFFGEIKMKFGVYLDSDYKLLDNTENKNNIEPVFIATIVQKR